MTTILYFILGCGNSLYIHYKSGDAKRQELEIEVIGQTAKLYLLNQRYIKMAIVMEYKTAAGVTIKINDAAYADKTEEEKQELRENVNKTVYDILSGKIGKR